MVGQSAEANPEVTFLGVAARVGVVEQPAFAFITAEGDVDVHDGTLHEPEFTERVNALTNQ